MSGYENEPIGEFTNEGLGSQITRLKDAVAGLRVMLDELKSEQQALPESERASLDPEIRRYEESIKMNEEEIERMKTDLLNHADNNSVS